MKRGESARLKCNASGDQPLTVKWTKDNIKLDKLGGHKWVSISYIQTIFNKISDFKIFFLSYEIFETTTDTGIISELLLRTTQRTDGTIYKCDAENEHGRDERTIKLVVVGIDY